MVGAPSPNTVRGVLRESLELEKLERQVNQALGSHLNRRYWKGLQTVAVNLVEVPYHGLAAQNPDEIRRGKAKLLNHSFPCREPLPTLCVSIA
jgi:hypothetical protein